MPLYVGTAQKRRRVKLLTAGNTVFKLTNVLGGTINLNAILNDTTNLRNHTLTWEQTKGELVTLSSSNTLETSYVISDNTDKTFEFYIDKGLNTQQTKKVEIYYTPTSTVSDKKGFAFTPENDNSKTIPNFRFEFGTEYPEPTGESNYNVDIKAGTGIGFDDVFDSFLLGNAIRLRLYGEVGVWTYNPTTLMKSVEAVDGKVIKFIFVENGSYAIEIDYIHNNISGEITYRSEPIFAFDVGPTENLFRGIDEVIPVNTGAAFKINNISRQSFLKSAVNDLLYPKSGQGYKHIYTDRKINTKIDNLETSVDQLNGTAFKFIKVTRLNPSQIGNS
jgi:hypothetical protein